MVVVRLARGGAKKRPFFNVIVTDKQNRRDGRFIERLGYYNPLAGQSGNAFSVAVDRVSYWQSQGAQVSPTVARLLKQFANKQAAPAA